MNAFRILSIVFVLGATLVATGYARASMKIPGTVVLRDNYAGFSARLTSARHGSFDVSIGESHEGDPGFDGNEQGSAFEVAVVIYHMEPKRQPLPYVSTIVEVAKGRQGESVTASFRGTRKVTYKGVTFYITAQNLSKDYGHGQTRIEVRAVEP
jgi:hypothetical protein